VGDELNLSGVTFDIDGAALAKKLIPHLVTALADNTTLQNALVNAIMPGLRDQMLALARSTASTGTITPRTGP